MLHKVDNFLQAFRVDSTDFNLRNIIFIAFRGITNQFGDATFVLGDFKDLAIITLQTDDGAIFVHFVASGLSWRAVG